MFGTLNQRWRILLQERDRMFDDEHRQGHKGQSWLQSLLKWCRQKLGLGS